MKDHGHDDDGAGSTAISSPAGLPGTNITNSLNTMKKEFVGPVTGHTLCVTCTVSHLLMKKQGTK
ncbi:MAG: hypothetical protein WCC17_08710 [Candidatus Nitrosopolaris sp.]